ncbi:MAG: hypothetical protein ACOC2K_04380, partial [Bacteroidota bacterium]
MPMYVIKCAKCKSKLFKYRKVGPGRVLRVWHKRIEEDYSKRSGDKIFCSCGNQIGTSDNLKIRMKQSSFTTSGSYE